MIIFDTSPQGSAEWLIARMGVCTGSRCKDARDRSDGLTEQQRVYVTARLSGQTEAAAMAAAKYKKAPTAEAVALAISGELRKEWSEEAKAYAMDLAREREGGKAPEKFVTKAMRTGTEQEPVAREQFEVIDGYLVQQAGFAYTEDRRFGCSVDGLLGDAGIWECKTMVSSQTLFRAMVYGDISDYRDQCLFELWLLRRKFVKLSLWCPDLQKLHTIHIDRDEAEMQALEDDLLAFDSLVLQYRNDLRKALGRDPLPAAVDLRENGRYAVQRAEKRIKTEVNDLKDAMSDEVARLTAIIAPVEAHVDGQIKARETQIAAEKAERERIAAEAAAAAAAAEAERKARHEAGIARIASYINQARGKTAAQIEAGIAYVRANITIDPAAWEEYATRAQDALYGTLQALQEMHDTALAREQAEAAAKAQAEENARVAAENARIAAELAEQRRAIEAQAAELRAQQEAARAQREAEELSARRAALAAEEAQKTEQAREAQRAADLDAQNVQEGCALIGQLAQAKASGAIEPEIAARLTDVVATITADAVIAQARAKDPSLIPTAYQRVGDGAAIDAAPTVNLGAKVAPAPEVPTLTMGAINARLSAGIDNGVSLTGAYVASLGIVGVKAPKGPGLLFTESQYRDVVQGLRMRLGEIAQGFWG